MVEPLSNFLILLGIGVAGLLIWAALSPFEALGWWAGWFGDEIFEYDLPPDGLVRTPRSDPGYFIVYLSGISRVSGETLSQRERNFLQRLAQLMPDAVLIDDIFPYSVNNLALTGQPFFAGLWRWALRRKLSGHRLETLAGYLINLRNIWQVAISVDRRYGPIYNQSMARVVVRGLARYGYQNGAGVPVIVLGYSGAGQIAIGITRYLKELLHAPVFVVTIGGIFGSDPGLLAADHVYLLRGVRDRPHLLGAILFPGRWPILSYSDWNKARRRKRITTVTLGDMSHAGATGYLTTSMHLPDGMSHLEKTAQTIAHLPYATCARSVRKTGLPFVDAGDGM